MEKKKKKKERANLNATNHIKVWMCLFCAVGFTYVYTYYMFCTVGSYLRHTQTNRICLICKNVYIIRFSVKN